MLQLTTLFSVLAFRVKSLMGLCLLLLATVLQPLQAETVGGLYTARAVVADQSTEARREILPAMLAEVLGRLVGEPDANELQARWPQLRGELQAAERYVGQFLYQTNNVADDQSQLILRAQFEEVGLARLIQRLQLPQWGADRPEVLVVLAWQGDGRRDVLASSPSSQLAAELETELQNVARRAGLPIALPLMDLQDQRDLPEQELRAGFVDRLPAVARRYGAEAVLLGRLRLPAAAGGQQGFAQRNAEVSWSLHQRNLATRYADGASDVRGGFETGVWMATRTMAERYAVTAGQGPIDGGAAAESANVYVLGIESLADLKKVEQHLFERTVVSEAKLLELKPWYGEKLTLFSVSLKGSVAKLEQALAVGRLLKPTSRPFDEATSAATTVPLESEAGAGRSRGRYSRPAAEVTPAATVNDLWYRLN